MDERKNVTAAENGAVSASPRRRAGGGYRSAALRLLVLLAVVWICFFKIVGLTHMPDGDMYPRIDAGDLVLFYRLERDVRAQDVAVIEKTMPDGGRELFISRVVAVGGDTVEIDGEGHLIINGNRMVESNIFSATASYDGAVEYPLQLGEGEYFVLADRRSGGTDSRVFGPVSAEEIQGCVISVLRRGTI